MGKTLKAPLADLVSVRIICRRDGCGAVAEIPIDKLAERSLDEKIACPLCKQAFAVGSGSGGVMYPLGDLAKTIQDTKRRLGDQIQAALIFAVED